MMMMKKKKKNETEVSEWLIMVYPTGSSYFLYQGCKCNTVSIGFQEVLTETGQDSIANSYQWTKNLTYLFLFMSKCYKTCYSYQENQLCFCL